MLQLIHYTLYLLYCTRTIDTICSWYRALEMWGRKDLTHRSVHWGCWLRGTLSDLTLGRDPEKSLASGTCSWDAQYYRIGCITILLPVRRSLSFLFVGGETVRRTNDFALMDIFLWLLKPTVISAGSKAAMWWSSSTLLSKLLDSLGVDRRWETNMSKSGPLWEWGAVALRLGRTYRIWKSSSPVSSSVVPTMWFNEMLLLVIFSLWLCCFKVSGIIIVSKGGARVGVLFLVPCQTGICIVCW